MSMGVGVTSQIKVMNQIVNKHFFLKAVIRPSQEKLMISDGKQYLIAYFPFDMSMNIQ
jgi:hypothetical protein